MQKSRKNSLIFPLEKKVYYHDTDCAGVVYYANYLKYLEEARTEFLLSCGVDLKKMAEEGLLFAVRKIEVVYKTPLLYSDIFKVFTRIEKIKYTYLNFYQWIEKKRKITLEAKSQLVCVNNRFRPQAIPRSVLKRLSKRRVVNKDRKRIREPVKKTTIL